MFVVCNSYVETVGWCQTYLTEYSNNSIEDLNEFDNYRKTDYVFKKVSQWQEENISNCFIGYSCKL